MYGLTVISSLIGSKYQVVNEAVNNITVAIEGGQLEGLIYETVISGIDSAIDGPCKVIMVEDVCTEEFLRFEELVNDMAAPKDIAGGMQFKKIVGTNTVNFGALNLFTDEDLLGIPADGLSMGKAKHDMSVIPEILLFGVDKYMINSRVLLTKETIAVLIDNPRLRTPAGIDELIEQGLEGNNMGMFAVGQYNKDNTQIIILHSVSPIFLAQWMKSNGVIVNYQSPFVSAFYGNNCDLATIVLYQKMLFNIGGDALQVSHSTEAHEALRIKDLNSNYQIVTKFNYEANGCRPNVSLPITKFHLSFSFNQVPTVLRKAYEIN